ncbi:MAG: ice-binding family protein [Dehalococcoidia bacterium]|nr:ice-binding family protein [Dehalococcoidia bacterium]
MNRRSRYLFVFLLAMVSLIGGTSSVFAAPAAPALGTAATFAALSAAPGGGGAVTCTASTISGDVGSTGAAASVVQTGCAITGAIVAPVSAQVVTDFNDAYDALAGVSCDQTLTGTLAGVTLAPGVYCFDAAATLTGTLTLAGPSDGIWIFKVGTSGTGALTGTNFSVVMAGGAPACNSVYWWVAEAATMTTSNFQGTVLAGAAITSTGGTFAGRALAKAAVTLTGAALDCETVPAPVGSGGVFVVGDGSATGDVLFWGAQWAKQNVVTGGRAPAAFKGFVSTSAPLSCGSNWATAPGNSSHPPATIGAYITVIVSSSISKSGSTIAGNTVKIVIVKTDPGYSGNPGHAGTGTVVATICG